MKKESEMLSDGAMIWRGKQFLFSRTLECYQKVRMKVAVYFK